MYFICLLWLGVLTNAPWWYFVALAIHLIYKLHNTFMNMVMAMNEREITLKKEYDKMSQEQQLLHTDFQAWKKYINEKEVNSKKDKR